MANYFILLFLAVVAFTAAKPIPDYDRDGQEILKGADTRYYGLPSFWYQRPLTGEDGDYYGGSDTGYVRPSHHHHETSIPLYETAGAGWGR